MRGIDPSLIWSLALVASLAYAVRCARERQLDAHAMYWAGVGALAGGLWGSHILGMLVHGVSDPLAWFRLWDGGKSYFGGLFVGALCAALVLRRRGQPVRDYAEAAVPAVALGYALARVGCFVNGDDYGAVASLPWSVRYGPGTEAYDAHLSHGWIGAGDPLSLPVHPAQLYAAMLGFGAFLLLRRTPRGRLPLFAAVYGIGRFCLEYLRGDFQPVIGPLSLPQCFCLLLMGIAAWLSMPLGRWREAAA
jgi:phosphatidylglycerol:prolipoprotein diacylglycerol transferase